MESKYKSVPLYSWAAEDTPSYKAEQNGFDCLTTSEVLAIILGCGSKSANAVELSRHLLMKSENSLRKLRAMDVSEIESVDGIGQLKALRIKAALELARRLEMEKVEEKKQFLSPSTIYEYMYPRIGSLATEEFWMLYLNNQYGLIKAKKVGFGGFTECPVDIRIIIREALLCNSVTVIACHNHPSGSLSPSRCDDELTDRIKLACNTMRIRFSDHVIITENNYYSYQENGKL